MNFSELQGQIDAEVNFEGTVLKPWPAEKKESQYGDYYRQNVEMVDASGAKGTICFKHNNQADVFTASGAKLTLKVKPRLYNGKVYVDGKIVGQSMVKQAQPQRASQPVANFDVVKNRSVALSYALKSVENGEIKTGDPAVFYIADGYLQYMETGKTPKTIQSTSEQPTDSPEEIPF